MKSILFAILESERVLHGDDNVLKKALETLDNEK